MNDIATELAKLHELTGAAFSRQVEYIANMHVFHLVGGETKILATDGSHDKDFENQMMQVTRKSIVGKQFVKSFIISYEK